MTPRPKLLITRVLPDAVAERAETRFAVDVLKDGEPLDSAAAAQCMADYDAIIVNLGDAFNAEAFELASDPRCRILANYGAGYNHIDAAAARGRGVVVTNTPGVVTDATADIALALILMAARRAAEGDRLVRQGNWRGWQPMDMLGQHVTGKTLGVIGMGRIGTAIARRCRLGFRMNVVFFNRSKVEGIDFPAEQLDSAEDVMAAADFVAVAVRSEPSTRHLVTEKLLRRMKPTGIFVNVSRGDVVDEAGLVRVLKEGRIASAGLDVYEFEPDVPEDLRNMEHVVLLPHFGTSVLEVREEMGAMALDNIDALFDGASPPNQVF